MVGWDSMLYDSCKTFDACSAQSLVERNENSLKAYVTKKNKNIKTDVVVCHYCLLPIIKISMTLIYSNI